MRQLLTGSVQLASLGGALGIACVGLYGTVSYSVARRTGEIGIRMALGAQRGTVVQMILREVLALAGVGLTIGAVAALAASKFVDAFLYGIRHKDTRSLLTVAAILLGAAMVAGCVPARRGKIGDRHEFRKSGEIRACPHFHRRRP